MPLDTARIITEAEYNAIWEEANACGEVLWQWNDVERRRAIPKRLGQGEEWIIDLHPGLSIHIATYQYWRSLCLDYHYNGEGMLLSNFYLAGDRRMINPGIQLEEVAKKLLVKPVCATSKKYDQLNISQPNKSTKV
ncbi:hypothetical protein IQ230_25070 [Gloeocapsopsis crepidinum LEGE 06123]|uniref:Uncharacterized protein n=1 Tax=Gloeocapsopsis crepidinum LEGE 06123 TaxID=588587 RepID=A0ABR9UYZ8_9CHRO|nr:hypothetical protein [Gloeocapsopsis crepidinum]MBE9193542.1 hypothetical protein [Gloeocapsopsis crepidinum LEGE 06123]